MNRINLEKILNENKPDINGKENYIWGTGNTATLYYEGFMRLKSEGFEIAGYCDNNKAKQGKLFNGKKVVAPETLKNNKDVCVLICANDPQASKEILTQVKTMNVEWHLIDEVILKSHSDDVLKVYDLLEDEISKNDYAELTKCRIFAQDVNNTNILINMENAYFAFSEFLRLKNNEIFVDCGAYVGDTIENYICRRSGVFKKIIAFEPDKKNFSAMKIRTDRLKKEWGLQDTAIQLNPYGVANRENVQKVVSYGANNGLGSKLADHILDEGTEIKVVNLDDFLTERCSFIKADIESYEYKMLIGAKKIISENKPLLAICIYHNSVDFYSLPLLVHELNPDYKLAIRHHSVGISETVLYAW